MGPRLGRRPCFSSPDFSGKEEYAAVALILFKRFRNVKDLQGESESLWDAFLAWERFAPEEFLDVLRNMDEYWIGKDLAFLKR